MPSFEVKNLLYEKLENSSSSPNKTIVLFLNNHNNNPPSAYVSKPRPRFTSLVQKILTDCQHVYAADGGANILHAVSPETVPRAVIGDLDSVLDDVLEKYKSLGSLIIHKPDQNSTDFTKAVEHVLNSLTPFVCGRSNLFAVGFNGGLLYHEMANCNVLFENHAKFQSLRLISENECTEVLRPNVWNRINIDLGLYGPGCGLIPLGRICTVSTKGFKWNLENAELAFGRLVSTSNCVDGETALRDRDGGAWVEVLSDWPILFTIEFAGSWA